MVKTSNPDKVLFPDGTTKKELVDHYSSVAHAMAPHISGRPLTLHRFPNGIDSKGFMQKNAPDWFPATISRVQVPKRDGITTYAVVADGEPLPYLANLGTISFHVWTSRVPNLELPDRLIFDLDPTEGAWEEAAAGAQHVRSWLMDAGVRSSVMTTGSKGYHVVVALEPRLRYDAVSSFARTVATLLAHRFPDLLTDEFRISARRGRVFIDWLRNRHAQTAIAPWSVRARPEAPVAVPIAWDELSDTPPDRFTIRDARGRLRVDPIADDLEAPQQLDEAVAAAQIQLRDAGIVLGEFDRFRS